MKQDPFEALYHRLKDKVYSTALRLCGRRDQALDASQDVFIKLYDKRKAWEAGELTDAYIYRMTVNRCLDFKRNEKRLVQLDTAMPDNRRSGANRVDDEDEVERLLSILNPEQRTAVVLQEISGLSYDEIAAATDTDIGTVRSRLSRAKDKMKEVYLR